MKGDFDTSSRGLLESYASTSLDSSRRQKERVARPVNEVLADMRREQRKKDHARSSRRNDEPAFLRAPPPPLVDDDLTLPPPTPPPAPAASSSRLPLTPAPRRPAGPPPPRSWTVSSPASLSSAPSQLSARAKGKAREDSFHLSCAIFDSCVPALSLHVMSNQGPPRLAHLCFSILAEGMEGTEKSEERLEEAAGMPRHLREAMIWWFARRGGPGVREEGARTLLWDLRDWGENSPESSEDVDSWEAEDADAHWPASSLDSGWPTLDLANSSLSLSTLKYLLLPLPTSPPTPSPVVNLSLAFANLPTLSSIIPVLPQQLRVLSLAGVKLLSVTSEELQEVGDGWWTHDRASRVSSLLGKLSRAAPLLQILDLSYTIPPLKPTLLSPLPWSSSSVKPTWPLLRTLALRGMMSTDGDGARLIRDAMKGRKGPWVDIVTE